VEFVGGSSVKNIRNNGMHFAMKSGDKIYL
jgi:hypothetical protein